MEGGNKPVIPYMQEIVISKKRKRERGREVEGKKRGREEGGKGEEKRREEKRLSVSAAPVFGTELEHKLLTMKAYPSSGFRNSCEGVNPQSEGWNSAWAPLCQSSCVSNRLCNLQSSC